MKGRVELGPELIWQKDGHLADAAIAALADAQDILPEAAHAHMQTCDECAARAGEAALVSLAMGEALRADAAATRSARPLPLFAVAAALVLAALGATPTVFAAARTLPRTVTILNRLAPVVARGALSVARQSGVRGVLLVSFVSLVLAVVAWTAVLRLTPVSKQGVIR